MGRLAVIVVLLGLVAAGCGGSSGGPRGASPSTFGVVGDIKVNPSTTDLLRNHVRIQAPCTAGNDFTDIHQGTQVVIEDETGKTIALGSLDGGLLSGHPGQSVFSLDCLFGFEIGDVPMGHPFYRVMVGRRGSQQYTAAQMQQHLHLRLS